MSRKDRAAAAAAAADGGDPEEDCMVAKLHAAIEKGNMSSANALLDAGASVEGCFEPDHAELEHATNPPLISAALDGNSNAVDLLIGRGADVNARGRVYRMGSIEDILNSRILTIEGTRPLHGAVEGNSLGAVRSLLRNGADPNTPDDEGDTPLSRAANAIAKRAKCAVEMAKELIKGGADVGVVNNDGDCPLLLAASNDNVPMVEELLRAGGDCSVANKIGVNALGVAANHGNTELIRLLLSAAPTTLNRTYPGPTPGEYGTALYAAAGYGHEDAVELLLELGAKQPTFSDEQKALCPLAAAVYFDHPGTVAILLRSRGLEAVGGVSCIPEAIQTAVIRRRMGILQILLNVEGEDRKQHWARISFKGFPMLHRAVQVGRLATINALLAAGADETATTADNGLSLFDVIVPCKCSSRERNLAQEAAIYRTLFRGPAFRARSWAWPAPSTVSKEAASAGPADGSVLVPRPRRAPKAPPSLGVRIYRPQSKKKHRNWFGRLSLKGTTRYGNTGRRKTKGRGRRPCNTVN